MNAWSESERAGHEPDAMGPAVSRLGSVGSVDDGRARAATTPPLKNGSELRAAGYLVAVGSRTARFRRKHKSKMQIFVLLTLLLLLLCLAVVMTVLYVRQKRHKPPRLCESRECLRSAANLALSMDLTVDPCDDFYQYVCGKWSEEHPRPDAHRSYDWFRDKQAKVYALVRDFLERNSSADQRPCPRPVRQARALYQACMDTETLDKRGLQPVLQVLETLGLPHYPTFVNVSDDVDYSAYTFDWVDAVVRVKALLGMDVLIGFDIFTDPKNSSIYRLVMGSPENTNPFPSVHNDKKRHYGRKSVKSYNRRDDSVDEKNIFNSERRFEGSEYKDKDDDDKIAQIYKLFYAELMKLFVIESGADKTTKLSQTELDFNILSAANQYVAINNDMYELESDNDTETSEDFNLNIPEYTADALQTHTDMVVEANNGTALPIWRRYLEGVFSISDVTLDLEKDKVLVSEPDLKYMALMASLVSTTPPVVIELYIWVKVVEVMSVHTTSELRVLFQRSSEGTRREPPALVPPPRTLQCASAVNDMLGMAVAYAIADPHFLNVTRPRIQTMLHEMKNALAHLVGKVKWMDDDTKLATYHKIVMMKTLIGFPDWLLEEGRLEEYYEGVEVDTEKHLENMLNIIQVKVKRALNKFRQGNNFTWATDPTEVNAYHTFQENTITVPLVMLQYPFFDLGLDSLNYGALGTVLGHEITHGFDNFGRQFDKNGNLLPWWSNDTIDSFVNQTQCFVDQYSHYFVPELDQYVDGRRTLGENIADNGGVREALAALRQHLRAQGGGEDKLPGFEHFSSDQLFFLSFGNLWCGVSTRESLRAELEDEHAPQRFRARGALQNSEEFARAWRCPPGAGMAPTTRCLIF